MNYSLQIAVLYGGKSTEHEVSVHSAGTVCRALQADERYRVIPILIDKSGAWFLQNACSEKTPQDIEITPVISTNGSLYIPSQHKWLKPDVFFPVLHGTNGEDGILRSATARWEGRQTIPAHENSRLTAIPMVPDAQAMTGNGQILVKAELPVEMRTTAAQSLPMVTDVELGQQRMPDPNRPSLILRRAGDSRLWDIARESGSTMEAIRNANGLQGEPKPDQMLLIPVP